MSTLEQTAEATEVNEANRPMSALDRCDSCGAQAYVRAELSGSELLFCAHHAKKHEPKLRPIADSWYDESHKLNA
ncbi:DUF7455 domain-containing protein [Leucobacter denitrificans]|uniref:DUF7455 domain-containing protein n=1 Tax=Leucobacter denitrificans TaxID=683042 RepID=UPI001FE685AA|nr:hypothetical protein [Leucobacter denitrificans]